MYRLDIICYFISWSKCGSAAHSTLKSESVHSQNNGFRFQLRFVAKGLLTISLYASLLNLGVSFIVPMKTKKRPRAKERATIVIVLGEAIFSVVCPGPPTNLCVSARPLFSAGLFTKTTGCNVFSPVNMLRGVGFSKSDKNGESEFVHRSKCPIMKPIPIYIISLYVIWLQQLRMDIIWTQENLFLSEFFFQHA